MHGCETMVRGRAVECELRHPEQGGAYIEGGAALDTERRREEGGGAAGGRRGEGPSLELDGNIITSEKPSRDLTRAFNRLPRLSCGLSPLRPPPPSSPRTGNRGIRRVGGLPRGIRGGESSSRFSRLKVTFLGWEGGGGGIGSATSNRRSKNRGIVFFFFLAFFFFYFESAHRIFGLFCFFRSFSPCSLDEFHRFINILFVIGIIIKGFCLPHYFR